MADLNELQSAGTTKVIGSDATGLETTPLAVETDGAVRAKINNAAGASAVNIQDGGNSITVDTPQLPATLGQKTMAASTAVVISSDQSAIPVTSTPASDKLNSGAIAALNAAYAVNTQGCNTVVFNISGTWVGTITPEASLDGTTWFSIASFDVQTDLRVATTTSNRVVAVNCGGYSQVRLRFSAFTSGSATIVSDAAAGLNEPSNNTIRNNNSTVAPQSQLIAGTDGTSQFPIKVDSEGRLVTSSLTGFGADFAFGDVTTAARTRVLVRRTSYNEQVVNGQRSIASANVADTAAGTGARTLRITYLDSAGTGPYTETLTLNGTTGVNTVATNICFIEQIEILTAGSGGVNAGIISLYTAVNKGGTVIGTIAATDNQTFWAHHYVPVGKICNITGVSCGHNGTTVGSGALFTINAKELDLANAVESQVSDFVRLYGQTSTFARNYSSPIKVSGPARLQLYVTPETTTATVYRAAFDFFEP